MLLNDDEQDTDEEQGANQYMQPVASQVSTSVKSTDSSPAKTQAPIPSSSQVDTITPIPSSSSNEPQLPTKQVSKQQKVKKHYK